MPATLIPDSNAAGPEFCFRRSLSYTPFVLMLFCCLLWHAWAARSAIAADWIMCSQSSTSDSSGNLYDSGGSGGSYQNNENCSFLISPPGSPVLQVELSYNTAMFDSITIHDGTDASAPELFMTSGFIGTETGLIASSGSVYVVFQSNGSGVADGFQLSWSPLAASYSISGRVFEDVGFNGTASGYAAFDSLLRFVDVELYDAANVYVASTVTDIDGEYVFNSLPDGEYKVRVRTATIGDSNTPPSAGFAGTCSITDPASGAPCAIAELTWAGSAPLYGGLSPTIDDMATADNAGPGDAYVSITLSGADAVVDFGVAYNLIVKTADSGQGSLRAFMDNVNALSGSQASQFRIPASDPNYNGGGNGEFTITPLSALPAVVRPITLDGSTQTANIGNSNSLGPEIELTFGSAGAADGVLLSAGSNGSTVCGLVINRAGGSGLAVDGSNGHTISGNYIGTNGSGTIARANTAHGIFLNNSTGSLVGGTVAGAANLISGNAGAGLCLVNSSVHQVLGNRIGTDRTGSVDLGNTGCGIELRSGATGNTIGGMDSAARNIISGNDDGGLILHAGADSNVCTGNYIGVSTTGSVALANSGNGVFIEAGALGNTIGGTLSGERNVISGNTGSGLAASGNNTIIRGNMIGLGANGSTTVPNGNHGIQVLAGSSGITIGGNIVSGNGLSGLFLEGSSHVASGNYFGLASDGASQRANGQHGIVLGAGAISNTIGGGLSTERNIVSSNTLSGLLLEGSQNTIRGNYFGLAANGATAKANGQYGIHIASGAGDNIIGGSTIDLRNVVSGNALSGMLIQGSGNIATGNYIGLGADCSTAVGNGQHGISIDAGAAGNRIGGTLSGEWNVIGYNGGSGVAVSGNGNTIISTRIFRNNALGIDLLGGSQNGFGVTANDPGDADSGPNDLLNYPDIVWAGVNGGNITVNYSLDAPAGNYRIDFFKNPSGADGSGYGEGENAVGAAEIAHPGGGPRSFSHVLAGSAGDILTVTATESLGGGLFGGTSEFSLAYTVLAIPDIILSKTATPVSDPVNGATDPKNIPGAIIEYGLAVSNHGPGTTDSGTVTITNSIPADTALFVGDIAGAGSGPVRFVDGATGSGLSFSFSGLNNLTDSVSFSSDNGASYNYVPLADGNGCDPAVTNLRIAPGGVFNASNGTDHPSFSISYHVRVD